MERDCADLGTLFQTIIGNLKGSFPLWEDLAKQGTKLHSSLRSSVFALDAFLESFQRLADFAINSRGASKDIGSMLTKLCLRHKTIENRLKFVTDLIMGALVLPLQEQIDDWKKSVVQIDKDHSKEYKKAYSDLKKASSENAKLQKKVNKGKVEARGQLELSVQEVNAKFAVLEATEKNAVTTAMVEERSRFCTLVNCLKPVMDEEIGMLSEVEHLNEVMATLARLAANPTCLPDQAITEACRAIPPQSTLERRKKVLKDDVAEAETSSNSSASSQQSADARTSAAPDLGQNQNVESFASKADTLLTDRPHTISSAYQHAHVRSGLSTDTYNPPDFSDMVQARSMPASLNPQSTPSARIQQQQSSKVADRIYARPALVFNKEANAAIAVATPTIPSHIVFAMDKSRKGSVASQDSRNSPRSSQTSLDSLNKTNVEPEKMESGFQHPGPSSNSSHMTSDFSALTEALRELEQSTAVLEMTYPGQSSLSSQSLQSVEMTYPGQARNSQSLQSVQCSSGYGTMTNISTGSVETVTSDFDALANVLLGSADFSNFDGYCTLPVKRQQFHSKIDPDSFRRPASTAGLQVSLDSLTETKQTNPDMDSEIHSKASNVDQSDFLPPPPLKEADSLPLPVVTNVSFDSDDDFPLPPPPDQMDAFKQPLPEVKKKPPPVNAKTRSLSMHTNVMQSLNAKLAVRNSVRLPSHEYSVPNNVSSIDQSQRASVDRVPVDPPTLAGDQSQESVDFSSQIMRGVQLRRTVSNDRSAPVIRRF